MYEKLEWHLDEIITFSVLGSFNVVKQRELRIINSCTQFPRLRRVLL